MTLEKNTLKLMLLIQLGFLLGACASSKSGQRYAYLLENRPQKPYSQMSTSDKAPTGGPASNVIIMDNRRPSTPAKVKPARPAATRPAPAKPSSSTKAEKKMPVRLSRVVSKAKSYMGTPYRYGGMNRKGIDCSGLVCRAYEAANVSLPHSSRQLSQMGKKVSRQKLREGDLVFFSSKGGPSINHVGIITRVRGRDVEFIHATTSRGVRIDKLNDGYWKNKYRKSVRL